MKVEIKMSNAKYRTWEYFLRLRYKSKASLEKLIIRTIAEIIYEEAKKDTEKEVV